MDGEDQLVRGKAGFRTRVVRRFCLLTRGWPGGGYELGKERLCARGKGGTAAGLAPGS